MTFFVGIDVGGTTTTIAIANHDREVLVVSDQFATRAAEGPQTTIADITRQILDQLGRLGATLDDVGGVSLATPGPATQDGVLKQSPNLDVELWDDFPFRQQLEISLQKSSPRPTVRYIGDGQAAALGEFAVRTDRIRWSDISAQKLQAARNDRLNSLFLVTVGTGLGGGEVRDGTTVRG
ncbi:MAG: ROK family protein, partial [Pirellulales bacterium]|nr:ROK family protein [Pirellulales bacterium]